MAEKNRYKGVNAHLMSYLQNGSDYRGFHSQFIVKLAGYLNKYLPENYRAILEDTALLGFNIGKQSYNAPLEQVSPAVYSDIEPDLYVPLPHLHETRKPLSIVIYEMDSKYPATVIELLLPGNKTDQNGRDEYSEKRYLITCLGIALVEIDLLHETPSVIVDLPTYPLDPASTPYYIAVSDPRTSDETAIFRFGINQLLTPINIPLLPGEFITANFDKVYQETFKEGRFSLDVDYVKEPIGIDSYSPADQEKIRVIMAK